MIAKRVLMVVASAAFVLSAGGPAVAHEYGPCQETNWVDSDGGNHPQYHDTYSRGWDATGINDVNASPVAYVFAHTGQYGVRNDVTYVEVRGGTGTSHDGANYNPNAFQQGGYVQGEVDPGNGVPLIDYHAGFYGDDYSRACLAVGGSPVVNQVGYLPVGPIPYP